MLHRHMQRSPEAAAGVCDALVALTSDGSGGGGDTEAVATRRTQAFAKIGLLATHLRQHLSAAAPPGADAVADAEAWWAFWGAQLTMEALLATELQAACARNRSKRTGCARLRLRAWRYCTHELVLRPAHPVCDAVHELHLAVWRDVSGARYTRTTHIQCRTHMSYTHVILTCARGGTCLVRCRLRPFCRQLVAAEHASLDWPLLLVCLMRAPPKGGKTVKEAWCAPSLKRTRGLDATVRSNSCDCPSERALTAQHSRALALTAGSRCGQPPLTHAPPLPSRLPLHRCAIIAIQGGRDDVDTLTAPRCRHLRAAAPRSGRGAQSRPPALPPHRHTAGAPCRAPAQYGCEAACACATVTNTRGTPRALYPCAASGVTSPSQRVYARTWQHVCRCPRG